MKGKNRYNYLLYKIKKEYELIDKGSLRDICLNNSINEGTASNSIYDKREIYGMYLIKKVKI